MYICLKDACSRDKKSQMELKCVQRVLYTPNCRLENDIWAKVHRKTIISVSKDACSADMKSQIALKCVEKVL